MKHKWLSIALLILGLVSALSGAFKDVFAVEQLPAWLFYLIAIPPVLLAVLQFYQDSRSLRVDKDSSDLAVGIEPTSDAPRKRFSAEEQERLVRLQSEMSKVQPGKSKLFVAPHISSRAFYNFALIAFNQRDFVRSEKYLKAALQVDKDNISAFNLLLQLYQSAVMNHLMDRELQAAELALKKATELTNSLPPNADLKTLVLIGYVYKSLGQIYEGRDPSMSETNWREAGRVFEKVLGIEHENPDALNGMGNVLHHKGRLEEALGKHEAALAIAPNYTAAANDAALVCEGLMSQDASRAEIWKDKAKEYWERVIELSRDDPQLPPDYASRVRNHLQSLLSENQ